MDGHYVFTATFILYSGFALIWQPTYMMCDMM